MEDRSPTAEKVPLCGRDFAGTTCAIRAMNTHVGVNDVLVSNDRDSEIRESSAQGAELDSSACNSSFRESRTSSLGQFNSSRTMKYSPSKDRIFNLVS